MSRLRWLIASVVLMNSVAAFADVRFEMTPAKVVFEGEFSQTQLLVRERISTETERVADLTRVATYESSDPRVVSVDVRGRVRSQGNGRAEIKVSVNGATQTIPVEVTGFDRPTTPRFDEDVMPVLAKFGCAAGACHAAQYGKGGFKLSVFGFAPDADHLAIVRDQQGRRINTVDPNQSLLVLKATGAVAHGGGKRIEPGSVAHATLVAWIAGGTPGPQRDPSRVTGLEIQPTRRIGDGVFSQQLRVVAAYSDGRQRDVTELAKFDSLNDAVTKVSDQGLVETIRPGQGGAMVRFQGQAASVPVLVPFGPPSELAGWNNDNLIDRHIGAKFRELGLTPAKRCDDATFLRRACLDVIGTVPSVDETRAFLASTDSQKRQKLVDRLLGLTGDPTQDIYGNAYAAYWSLKWADLLRSNSKTLGDQGMWAMHNWLQNVFRNNMPFDKFVTELITARGSLKDHGPTNFFQAFNTPDTRSEAVAQIFLGVRVQCAKCHHHPYETISQEDYYRLAGYFARVGLKVNFSSGVRHEAGEIVVLGKGESTHPRTGQVLPPAPLHGPPSPPSFDRRKPLADWIVASDNPFFARNVVNRYWFHLLGRGLVDPVDDLRATNPPSHPELLDELAADFRQHGYDVKHLLKTILNSQTYQLDSRPPRPSNDEARFYTSYNVKRIAAEPLLDALDVVTGVTTKFPKLPVGVRAIELPDGEYEHDLLTTFGKPKREGVCECDRSREPNLAQALHITNSETLITKLAHAQGRIAKLLAANTSHDSIVEEFYLATLNRFPSSEERQACTELFRETSDPRTFYEDLLWSLLNSKQFLLIH